jgi:hypothetical protein
MMVIRMIGWAVKYAPFLGRRNPPLGDLVRDRRNWVLELPRFSGHPVVPPKTSLYETAQSCRERAFSRSGRSRFLGEMWSWKNSKSTFATVSGRSCRKGLCLMQGWWKQTLLFSAQSNGAHGDPSIGSASEPTLGSAKTKQPRPPSEHSRMELPTDRTSRTASKIGPPDGAKGLSLLTSPRTPSSPPSSSRSETPLANMKTPGEQARR